MMDLPSNPRMFARWLAFAALTWLLCLPLRSADKVESWVEVRTPHFVVGSDGGEKGARRVAEQFELARRVFQAAMPNAHLDTGIPIQILAARDAKSFAALMPEFPVDKRRAQPTGLFVSGMEKNYVALRLNAGGQVPYQDVFQEYARLILKRSYRNLPPWLEEGYANAFGSMTLTEKGARLGRPDPEDLSVLWESPLLPLDIVLQADRNSPYYTNGSKDTVYFAESRALVHFLLTDPQAAGAKLLDRYVSQVENGADPLQTAHQVFGDLNQLRDRLESYVKQTNSAPAEFQAAPGSENIGPARALAQAETEAWMGDFALHRGRADEARSKLEDALKLQPSLARAEESLGYLALQQNHGEEADRHLNRALELDPKDALAHYGRGLSELVRSGSVGVPLSAIGPFESAAAINPDFAPTWAHLASIYVLRPETLAKALPAAQRAVSLEPGNAQFQYDLAMILEKTGRTDEAKKLAAQIQKSAGDSRTADQAAILVARMSEGRPLSPPPSMPVSPDSLPASPPRLERRSEPGEERPSGVVPAAPPAVSKSASEPPAPSTRVYSMVGVISEVNCAETPQVVLTLKAQTLSMHLHAADFALLAVTASGGKTPAKITACSGLRGRNARISYLLSAQKRWDGEIQSIELRTEP